MYKYIKLLASYAENRATPKDRAIIKYGLIGFFLAATGYLIAVFFNHKVGFLVCAIGVIVGVLSVLSGQILMMQRYKEDKDRQEEFINRKQPWE